MASGLLKDYVGRGLLAARPATPTPAAGVGSYYYGTDTLLMYSWDGAAWQTVGAGGGGGSPVAVGAHRYWRIVCRGQTDFTNYSGYSGIDFRIVAGGANVATGGTILYAAPAQATPTSTIFGGNGTSDIIQWSPYTGVGMWIGYDFGAGVTKILREISIYPLYAAASRTPNAISVQYSDDGATWYEIHEAFIPQSSYTLNVKSIISVPLNNR